MLKSIIFCGTHRRTILPSIESPWGESYIRWRDGARSLLSPLSTGLDKQAEGVEGAAILVAAGELPRLPVDSMAVYRSALRTEPVEDANELCTEPVGESLVFHALEDSTSYFRTRGIPRNISRIFHLTREGACVTLWNGATL